MAELWYQPTIPRVCNSEDSRIRVRVRVKFRVRLRFGFGETLGMAEPGNGET